jgi:hypothetical protein
MLKSASLRTKMVFSKILHGYAVESQGHTLEAVAALIAEGRIRPIATTRLSGLTPEAMRTAHDLLESRTNHRQGCYCNGFELKPAIPRATTAVMLISAFDLADPLSRRAINRQALSDDGTRATLPNSRLVGQMTAQSFTAGYGQLGVTQGSLEEKNRSRRESETAEVQG